jgi:hypothetical protein
LDTGCVAIAKKVKKWPLQMYVVLHFHPLGRQLHEPVAKSMQTKVHPDFLPFAFVHLQSRRPSIAG